MPEPVTASVEKLSDWWIVGATVLGPILAVQAQKWIERATEKRRRKLGIFYALMATRAARVSPDHVRALNQIDIEFSGARFLTFVHWQTPKEKQITDAWKIYSDHLNQKVDDRDRAAVQAWLERGDDLFVDLLYSMSRYFGFSFDRIQLKRGVYSPRAHSDAENQQLKIQNNLARLLAGEQSLRMDVVSFPVSEEALKRQEAVQDAIVKALDPSGGVPVIITDQNGMASATVPQGILASSAANRNSSP